MWDVCTGSGCVAIAVARQVEEVSVLATDICTEALAVAEANALAHGVQNRVCVRQADLLELPGDVGGAGQFEVITANPPYVATGDTVAPEVAYEPAKALMAGEDGMDFIRPIVASAGEFITPGGMLAMEFGRGQADDVRNLIAASGCFGEPRMTRDYQGIERIAAAVRR